MSQSELDIYFKNNIKTMSKETTDYLDSYDELLNILIGEVEVDGKKYFLKEISRSSLSEVTKLLEQESER